MSRLRDRSRCARDAASQFSIERTGDHPGRARIAAAGELDVASVDALSGALRDATARAPCVLLDITRVSFIDPTALRAIAAAHRDARDAGHDLTLSLAEPDVERMLEFGGLATTIEREPGCPKHGRRRTPDPLSPAARRLAARTPGDAPADVGLLPADVPAGSFD